MGDQFVTHLPISDHLMTTGRAYAKDQFWGSMKSNLEEIILNKFRDRHILEFSQRHWTNLAVDLHFNSDSDATCSVSTQLVKSMQQQFATYV